MNSKTSFFRGLAVAVALTILAPTAEPAQDKILNVRGSLAGHGTGSIQGPNLQASGGGAGVATHIGGFTYVLHLTVNLAAATSTGLFVMVFANGDVLHGSLTGVEGGSLGQVVETLTINGGTGRFIGATGNLIIDRTSDPSTLPAYEAHTGTIKGTINTK